MCVCVCVCARACVQTRNWLCLQLLLLTTGFESRLRRDFPGSSHTSDLKIGTPVATLPGAWRYRVSAGTGWFGVSMQ